MDPEQHSVAKEFDLYNESYEDTVNASLPFAKADFFTRVKIDYFIEILKRHEIEPKAAKVLDMGCGIGMYHRSLKTKVGSLHGIDVSSDCIEQAKKMNEDVSYESYNGGRLPYPDNSFDSIMVVCVMHHVPVKGRSEFMDEMLRVLKPSGLGVMFEHNPINPLTMRVVNNCPFDADAVLLKSGTAEKLFEESGFNTPKTRFILSIPPPNEILRSIDRLFSKLPLGAQYYTIARKPQ